MPANRMNRDEFYAAMGPLDEARLRKALWTVYWRGTAQVRERIEDELRPEDKPKARPKQERPDPVVVLGEVTSFVELARSGAYMGRDRRVHHTERSKWRHTFRRRADDALAALSADDPAPAQEAVALVIDLCLEMKSWDYFHSEDPVEAAKFVVSDAAAALWESILRHDGLSAFYGRVPGQLIRWEQKYGWTRGGWGQTAQQKETQLAVQLARMLTTPDMWRTFTESYVEALKRPPRVKRPVVMYGSGGRDSGARERSDRTSDLATWHEMLVERFLGTPEDELLDRLVNSTGLGGPDLIFLRAQIAERRGDTAAAAALVTDCLNKLPGHPGYLDFAARIDAKVPARARRAAADRARLHRFEESGDPNDLVASNDPVDAQY